MSKKLKFVKKICWKNSENFEKKICRENSSKKFVGKNLSKIFVEKIRQKNSSKKFVKKIHRYTVCRRYTCRRYTCRRYTCRRYTCHRYTCRRYTYLVIRKKQKETTRIREKTKSNKRAKQKEYLQQQHTSRFLEAPLVRQADGELKNLILI